MGSMTVAVSALGLDEAVDFSLAPALPEMTSPTYLAAGAAAIITGLLLLLHLYRKRPYILHWTAGWTCLTASLAIDASWRSPTRLGAIALGGSQLLMVAGALCFVAAADAYRQRSRERRTRAALVLTLGTWFLLSPLIWGVQAVLVSGYLLTAGALALGGITHLLILRQSRLLGAAVVGSALLIAAATNVWMMLSPAARGGPAVSDAFFLGLALYLVTALGMQLMTFEDMTLELKSANASLETAQIELRQMVVTDALTGLRNRRFFDEVIGRELNLHRRYGTPLSVLFLDIDRFKTINDTLGHAAGDRTLRDVATFLHRKIRDADYVFRWGGDEFLLLLSCREDEAQRRGLELQNEFRATASATLPPGVALSFGCAEVSPLADSVSDALKLADERMYANKRAARMANAKAV
jgi:diguanylate cyclase (GGDEF)-like protein